MLSSCSRWVTRLSLSICCLLLSLVLAIAPAAAQTASVASAPIDYQRVSASVQQSGVTPHLPRVLVYSTSLAGPNRIFAVGGSTTNPETQQPGYSVQITNSEYCLSGALSCIIAYADAEPLTPDVQSSEDTYAWFREPGALSRYVQVSRDPIGWVRLSNGQSVYFVPWVLGANMGFAQAIWDEGGYRYTIAVKGGDRSWVLAMANSSMAQ
ncbi:MAG: hypothetical protein RBJ76_01030 [Stenomitos frigidus ULC029]